MLTTVFLTAILAGCTTPGERAEELDQRILAELEAAAQQQPPSPAETRDLLLPPDSAPVDEAPEERFHVTVEDAPARQFLMSLVADTDINMVVHPDVDLALSLELRNVTIDEVMEIVREVYGLEYRRTDTGYIVRPPSLEHRVYEVSYLDINREGSSRTRVSSGQSTENPAAMQDQVGGGLGRGAMPTGGGDSDGMSGTRIETESRSNFWENLEDAVTAILDDEEGRNVMVNPMSGVVAVRAMPHEQRAVAELLEAIQGSVQRQVVLEAKIIEVELRDGFRSGINWTALQDIQGRLFSFGQVGGPDIFEDGISSIHGRELDVRPGEVFSGFESSAFGGSTVLAADTGDFNAFIELLETQGMARVLSSPRVSTINNQKAVIKVGTDEFFVTGVTGRTTAGAASATAASSVQLTPFFSGIALDVTPQISRDGDIILHIHPTVSEVQDQTKSFTVAGQEETLPLAFSSVRQSDSVIRARNGQVVVIGGLMRESSEQQRFGTPFLSRIPLIGHAFGGRQEQTVKTELVILLRPVVVDDEAGWGDHASDSLDRMRGMSSDQWPR
ncbi:pilus (MSHA type) biogenesis protein MshL [Wenzhouxiangella sp. AB-CW3]|nr:pilus (MSHA type) biogenesis protein MshL [Wenzhouxiangella sp. AB-CW3]